jgi:hypothetical protein
MENLLHNKWVLFGGVAVVALGGWYFISNANASAAASSSPDTANLYSATPAVYSSGTGTPVDTTGNSSLSGTTGNSSVDYLNALISAMSASGAGSTGASAAEIAMQQSLGEKSIASNQTIALANVDATQNSTLAQLAGTLSQTITNTGISEQQILATNGTQSVTVTGVSVANKPKYNYTIGGSAGGIVLPSGQTIGGKGSAG